MCFEGKRHVFLGFVNHFHKLSINERRLDFMLGDKLINGGYSLPSLKCSDEKTR